MYEQFHGFCDSPSNIAPDPRFLFFSGRHQEALITFLLNEVNQNHDAVLVINEAQNLSPEREGTVP